MSQKKNAVQRATARHNGTGETERRQRLVEQDTFAVSVHHSITTPRACQTTARRILLPMLTTASRNQWTRILDGLLDLYAKWEQSK